MRSPKVTGELYSSCRFNTHLSCNFVLLYKQCLQIKYILMNTAENTRIQESGCGFSGTSPQSDY